MFGSVMIAVKLNDFFYFSQAVGPSMLPSIKENQILVISNIFPKYNKNDIVSAVNIGKYDSMICKRIIGIPGDTIKTESGKEILLK